MGKAGVEFNMEPNNLTSPTRGSTLASQQDRGPRRDEGGVVPTTKSRNPARIGKVRRSDALAPSASERTSAHT